MTRRGEENTGNKSHLPKYERVQRERGISLVWGGKGDKEWQLQRFQMKRIVIFEQSGLYCNRIRILTK